MRIRDSVDPLSDEGRRESTKVIIARSETLRVLQYELDRYCNHEIQGRSFLIAGHRGAGKTTLVSDALRECLVAQPKGKAMRPLPIFLYGPALLEALPSDLLRDDLSLEGKTKDAPQECGVAVAPPGEDEPARKPEAGGKVPATGLRAIPPEGSVLQPGSKALTRYDEKLAQIGLVQIILGLHRAVSREFTQGYWRKIQKLDATHEPEAAELAAQFEIELAEDPPASRLREFWARAEALMPGVLFPGERSKEQGALELVALNGMCNAHQRISGALDETRHDERRLDETREKTSGFNVATVEALKPLAAVFAGTAVAGGAVIGDTGAMNSVLLGLGFGWLASLFLKRTATSINKRVRSLDRSFMPDLTLRTLYRILPSLLDRLRDCGLAPVFIIDELDKVPCLSSRIERLVCYLKQLVSENVFSCFLTDRGYFENLRAEKLHGAYGRAFSYFSHRLMVGYEPREFDLYLSQLIDAEEAATHSAMDGVQADTAKVDREVLKWVLRHRSQLHALSLQREIAALRGLDGRLDIESGAIRSDYQHRIDLTLQMAIELTFYSEDVVGWCHRRAALRQTLLDALYFPSRSWIDGGETIEFSEAGMKAFTAELIKRMNLREMAPEILDAAQEQSRAKSENEALDEDDCKMLETVLRSIVAFLCTETTVETVKSRWTEVIKRMRWPAECMPAPEVMVALLLGGSSLLERDDVEAARLAKERNLKSGELQIFRWQFYRSGRPRRDTGVATPGVDARAAIPVKVAHAMAKIEAFDAMLLEVIHVDDPQFDEDPFVLLADRWRVIDTTPAWQRVKSAIANLHLMYSDAGNKGTFARDCEVVLEFGRILAASENTIERLLKSAAILRGLAATLSKQPSLRQVFGVLCDSLSFARVDFAGVKRRFDGFWDKLIEDFPFAVAAKAGVTDADMPKELEQLSRQASNTQISWGEHRSNAWSSLAVRLTRREGIGTSVASYSETLCSVGLTGPGNHLPPDLLRATLENWTRILTFAVGRDRKPAEGAEIQEWLPTVALRELGACNLPRQKLDRMLKPFMKTADARCRAVIRQIVQTDRSVNGRIAIVARSWLSGITNAWTSSPQLGFVMVVPERQLLQSGLLDFARGLESERGPLVAWEMPDSPDEDEVHDHARAEFARLKLPGDFVYMYAREQDEMRKPAIFDPGGPDAVFARIPDDPR